MLHLVKHEGSKVMLCYQACNQFDAPSGGKDDFLDLTSLCLDKTVCLDEAVDRTIVN